MTNKVSKSGGGGSSIFSGALNNINFLSGGVDPQTGLYSTTFDFGEISGCSGQGPSFRLQMQFNSLNTIGGSTASTLGVGWSFFLPTYNSETKSLTLMDGKSYKVAESSVNFDGPEDHWMTDRKLKDVNVFGSIPYDDNYMITVQHKEGHSYELLSSSGSSISSVYKLIGPNGRYLKFNYENSSSERVLKSIEDDEDNVLIEVVYGETLDGHDSTNTTTVKLFPSTPEERLVELYFGGADLMLDRIKLQTSESEVLETFFTYQKDQLTKQESGFDPIFSIKGVTHPSGAIETISYHDLLTLPNEAPWTSKLPAVTDYQRQDSNLLMVVTTYDLNPDASGKNFLGAEQQGVTWEDSADGLANLTESYEYSTLVIEGETKETKYTFNKFHQEIEKTTHFGDKLKQVTQTSTYYSDGDQSIDNQDPRYELCAEKQVNIQDGEDNRALTTVYDFDEWGNLLLEVSPSGVREVTEYYHQDGEEDACPEHPFGHRNFPKSISQETADSSSTVESTHTYKALPSFDGASTQILLATTLQAGQLISFTYHGEEDGTVPFAGFISQEKHEIGLQSRTMDYTYETVEDEFATISRQIFSGSDGTTSSRFEKASWLSGLIFELTEPDGVNHLFGYDKLGRVIEISEAVGTPFEALTTYSYIPIPVLTDEIDYHDGIATDIGLGWMVKEETPSRQRFQHTVYDGARKELRSYVRHEEGSYYKISELEYDKLGQVIVEHALDYDLTGPTLVEYRDTEYTRYGSWGEPEEKETSTGLITKTLVSPVDLSVIHQQIRRDEVEDATTVTLARNRTRTTYNLFQKPEQVERLDSSDVVLSVKQSTFDGFGRPDSRTNAVGETLSVLTRDYYGRPLSLTHFDETVYELSYSETNFGKQPSSITTAIESSEGVPGTFAIGSQISDLLDRVSSRTVGGATISYDYEGGQMHPYRTLNNRGQTALFEFIPALDNRPARITTFDGTVDIADWDSTPNLSDHDFTYADNQQEAPLGLLKEARTDQGSRLEYNYGENCLLADMTQTTDGTEYLQDIIRQTLQGKVLELDVHEQDGVRRIIIGYDSKGKQQSVQEGDIVVATTDNLFGNLETETVLKGETLLQETTVTYDDNGLEDTRTIDSQVGNGTLLLELGYDVEDRLNGRKSTVNDVLVRDEAFAYDAKGRLEVYAHEAGYDSAYLPKNAHEMPFVSQSFVYDSLDNIDQLITTFPDGSFNTSTYTYSGQQLTHISNDLTGQDQYPADTSLSYDADGNLTQLGDDVMSYSVFNRLESCDNTEYGYDAFQRIDRVGDTHRVYFQTDSIGETTADGEMLRLIRFGNRTVAEKTGDELTVLGSDRSRTVVQSRSGDDVQVHAYSPLGENSGTTKTGFNGQLRDSATEGYLLGNGVRAYFPILGNFSSQDDFSPFSGGGLNPYAYCERDPMNLLDPSGHVSEAVQLGVAVGVAVLGVISSIAGVIFAIPTGGATLTMSAVAMGALGLLGSAFGAVSSVLTLASASVTLDDELHGTDRTEQINKLDLSAKVFGLVEKVFSLGTMGYTKIGKGPKFPETISDKTIENPMKSKDGGAGKLMRKKTPLPSAQKGSAKASSAFGSVKSKGQHGAKKANNMTLNPQDTGSTGSNSTLGNVPERPKINEILDIEDRKTFSSSEVIGDKRNKRLWSGHSMDTDKVTVIAMRIIDND